MPGYGGREPWAAWVNHNQLRAAFGCLLNERSRYRVVLRCVRANDKRYISVLDIGEHVRDCVDVHAISGGYFDSIPLSEISKLTENRVRPCVRIAGRAVPGNHDIAAPTGPS